VAPRRRYNYPRASTASASGCASPLPAAELQAAAGRGRPAAGKGGGCEGARRVFRGKSLTDDVLMRRFVVEDGGGPRRRDEMEVVLGGATSNVIINWSFGKQG
jgi:hypothetical protein